MDDFFGDDTASADQHDEENETHGTRPLNNGESAAGGNIPRPCVFIILC